MSDHPEDIIVEPPIPSDEAIATMPHALSSVQERRLTDYLDERILEIQREYKKRNYESSSLRTLSAYLEATHPLLTLILMIPPIDASVPLRASLLLRLTGELLECMPGYTPNSAELSGLVDVLEELDRGWLAVLRSQVWNVESREGMDMIISSNHNLQTTLISQTDRTRLRSLLLSGTDKLEQWLEDQVSLAEEVGTEEALKVLKVRPRFDDLFLGTLAEMGELRGAIQ